METKLELSRSIIKKLVKPPYTRSEVDQAESIFNNNKLHKEKARLLANGVIDCPNCKVEFPLMNKELVHYHDIFYITELYPQSQHAKYKQWYDTNSDLELNAELSTIKKLEDVLESLNKHINSDMLKAYEKATSTITKLYDDSARYNTELDKLVATVRDYFKFTDDFFEDLPNRIAKNDAEITKLSELKQKLSDYYNNKTYMTAKQESMKVIKTFVYSKTQEVSLISDLTSESKVIKLSIQKDYIPTLNEKASSVVNDMTGGERFSLTISDSFDLLLDGKEVNLYSGSTKVISNIAFRTAIIELFYKKSFPLIIGDEIDSFMDKDRAKELQGCFDTLAKQGYQILLISHHLQEDGTIIDIDELKNASKNKV
jgi:DNA repair exonuclease SbcCD ATPase subunit